MSEAYLEGMKTHNDLRSLKACCKSPKPTSKEWKHNGKKLFSGFFPLSEAYLEGMKTTVVLYCPTNFVSSEAYLEGMKTTTQGLLES